MRLNFRFCPESFAAHVAFATREVCETDQELKYAKILPLLNHSLFLSLSGNTFGVLGLETLSHWLLH